MKVLRFLRLLELLLAQGRLGREVAGWSQLPLPLAELMKSPGRLLQFPGRVLKSPSRLLQSSSRVLKSPGWVRLSQSPGRLSNSLCRLLGSSSRIRLLQEEPAQRWNPTLAMA